MILDNSLLFFGWGGWIRKGLGASYHQQVNSQAVPISQVVFIINDRFHCTCTVNNNRLNSVHASIFSCGGVKISSLVAKPLYTVNIPNL